MIESRIYPTQQSRGCFWELRLLQFPISRERNKETAREKILGKGICEETISDTRDLVLWMLERRERSNYQSRCRKRDREKKNGKEGRKEDEKQRRGGEGRVWFPGTMSASVDRICSSFLLCAFHPSDDAVEKCVFYHHITAAIRSMCTTFLPLSTVLRLTRPRRNLPRDERSSHDPVRTRFSSRQTFARAHPFVEFADYFDEKWRKALLPSATNVFLISRETFFWYDRT